MIVNHNQPTGMLLSLADNQDVPAFPCITITLLAASALERAKPQQSSAKVMPSTSIKLPPDTLSVLILHPPDANNNLPNSHACPAGSDETPDAALNP